MGKQVKSLKPLVSGEPKAVEGAGAKRSRDGAASSAAAKAADMSGDDRFSLSKFQLDERFKSRAKAAAELKAAAERERSEEEELQEDEEFGDDDVSDGHDDTGEDYDDDDGGDDSDGNYDVGLDDDVGGGDEENGGGSEGEVVDGDAAADGGEPKAKKIGKKLKPMSPEELAAFMKVVPLFGDAWLCVMQFAGTRAARCRVSQPHSALHEAHQGRVTAAPARARVLSVSLNTQVRHLLQKFGEIGRIYLTPENSAVTKRRRKMGGNKRVKYEDGWVEFMDKKKARQVASMLNGQPMGNKNRGFFEHDLWTIK